MITKFEKYNESIRNLLVGPTEEELWNNLFKKKLKKFINTFPDSSEDFFLKMKEGCKIYLEDDKYIYWGKKGIVLFWQDLKNNRLLISDKYIWSILYKVYGLNYIETQFFIKKLLSKDINWKNLKPQCISVFVDTMMLEI